jgi:hypothetical protein
MKALIFLLIYSLHSADITCAYAQESNIQLNHACHGKWIIQNFGSWSVRNTDGITIPLSPQTLFYDCQNHQFQPTIDHNGLKVDIECLQSNQNSNFPNVTKVFFICE